MAQYTFKQVQIQDGVPTGVHLVKDMRKALDAAARLPECDSTNERWVLIDAVE